MSPAIPKDSIVLVTGANGYIASHVVDQFLKAGYRVRGTTRDLKKLEHAIPLWESQYGKGRFEAVVVPDMAVDGAFDSAMEGVSAVIHLASDVSFNPDPNKVIPQVVAGVKSVLESALKHPTIKRFVYTSSSTAAMMPVMNTKVHIDSTTWNIKSSKAAWAPPPYLQDRANDVYATSKTEGEQAVWKFVEEKKPSFVVNAVLPDAMFGKILAPGLNLSTAGLPIKMLEGVALPLDPQWFVDVQDAAILHLAAAVESDVKNERIMGYAETFTWNQILRIFRKIRPDQKIIEDYADDNIFDISTVSNERSVELLARFGRKGWTSFEKSIENNIEGL